MKKIFTIFFAFVLLTGFESDQSEEANAKIKVILLYNFTKYIEWPYDYKQGNFIITTLGTNSTFITQLNHLASTKMAGNQKFEIKSLSSADNLGKCHILYLAADNKVPLTEILPKLKGSSTLIVTEKQGAAKQGAIINFIVKDNKQKFELNKSNAEKYNLKVSSNLTSLAVLVE